MEMTCEGATVAGTEKLVHYSLLAGERALATYAHEEAMTHFERGLAAKEGQPMGDGGREAKARADFDLRWKVALGIEAEDRPFAKSTLQVFRAQLILHDKVREVFESSLRLARESGCLKRRGMRVALDTTNILGRGAVKDTYNLLADGIVKLLRALAAVEQAPVREWAQAQGYERYLGSSEAAIDWADRQARTALLAKIVADADQLLELSRQAQGELPEDGEERQRIVAAAELLGQLLLQDVERTEGGVSLKDGVSRDRMMSVHDPEMRHGHKSSSRRFDGHKAAKCWRRMPT